MIGEFSLGRTKGGRGCLTFRLWLQGCLKQGFWYFAQSRSREIGVNPWNPVKFTRTRKILRNSVEILSNTRLYSNFETCLSYWGYLLAVNSQIYVKTSSLKRANNVPKLPGVDYVAKNWALAMMLKALPLVHFWSVLLLKEQMMTSVRKMLKMLVWSVQTDWFLVKFALKITTKSAVFLPIAFRPSLPPKIPAKSADFSAILSLKIPRNLTFIPPSIRSPVNVSSTVDFTTYSQSFCKQPPNKPHTNVSKILWFGGEIS